MLKVYNTCCKNCLLSKDRIVSPQRAKSIVKQCKENQMHFVCHKATIEGTEIVCKGFYDKFGKEINWLRIAKEIGMLEFVPQPAAEKLPTYSEMNK